jgi:hypothetical protein
MLSLGPTSIEEPLGKIAFERLRAEDEPWLEACFVPPPDLAQIMGDRSVVVLAGPVPVRLRYIDIF